MTKTNVIDPDGRVRMCSKMCDTCVFGTHSPVSRERVEEMLAKANNDGCIPCHHTLDDEYQNVCAGFAARTTSAPVQIAQRMGLVNKYEPTDWLDDKQ